MILNTFSTFYGQNAYILDPTYSKVVKSFGIDARPRAFSVSSNGRRIAIIAEDSVLCVHDLKKDEDVFFRGTRIKKKPKLITTSIDTPFFSHIRDSGAKHLIYTQDNSWDTGNVFVHNLKTNKNKSFDARNGHIELDVSFPSQRIALSGTSTDLTVLDFDAKEIAHKKDATQQRNSSVEFSPSGDRILVGSWDSTISVFSVDDKNK